MSFYEILLAKKLEDKRVPQVKGLTVTKNGTYSESGIVYNVVNVNVPLPENCYQKKTASGAMVSFTDGTNEPLSDLVIFITAAQSGSGEPSPTNIRPISGWTGANITNKDDINNPTVANNYSVSWQSQAGTVYGGTLDVVSGELVVDMAMYVADGSESVQSVRRHTSGLYFTIVKGNLDAKTTNPLLISSRFKAQSSVDVAVGNCYVTSAGQLLVAVLPEQTATTKEAATQWFADNPTQFVYELATPLTYQLTPIMVRTLLGNNNIYADCGAIDVLSYFTKLN